MYSSSAAEVFWDRSDQPGLSYEVSVDGGSVTTTDGTSAFLTGLDGARGRGVNVVAIDANGQRSGAANVTLGGGSGGGNPNPPSGGGSGGSDVPAPSSLRAELYSGSAGEVFWDRVSGTNLSYEVSFDGEVVTTTTGTSYFAGNRPGIDGTSVEVVAIGPDGSRSSASSTTLGNGGGSANPDPGPDPETDAPPAPANARIERYSSTTAELFFDRAPASANVVRTEVSRDGVVIGETNGTSFLDDTRSPNERFQRYTLVAVSGSGQRSEETVVGGFPEPTLPDVEATNLLTNPGTSSPLSSGNSDQFLPGIVAVANAAPLEAIRATFDNVRTKVDFDQLDVSSTDGFATTYGCDGGGTVTVVESLLVQRFGTMVELEASNCIDRGRTLDGKIVSILSIDTEIVYEDVLFTDEADVSVSFDGTYEEIPSRGGDPLPNRQYSWTGDWQVASEGETLRVEDFETAVVADLVDGTDANDGSTIDVPLRRFTSSFDVTGPLTGGTELTVSTPLAFAADGDDEYYDVGRLEVRAPDGSQLTIGADTGDVDTAAVTFDDGMDAVIPWRPEIRFAYGTLP